jgi:hypothetical protein
MTVDHSLDPPRRSVSRRVLTKLARADRPDYSAANDPIRLPTDAVYRLLSNGRRRAVIAAVAALDPEAETALGDLAQRIAAIEHDVPVARVGSGQRKSVYVSLLQCHLPKLDDAGVVDWDRRSGAVARGKEIDELAALIDAIERACST